MSGEHLSGAAAVGSSEWDGLTNAQRFRAEQAKLKAEAIDPEELKYYQEHPDKLEQLSGKTDPDERKEEADWYRARPEKIANLILVKNQRLKAEAAKAAAEAQAVEADEDFGQAVRDVLAEEAAAEAQAVEADEDFGQAVRDVLAEEAATESTEADSAAAIDRDFEMTKFFHEQGDDGDFNVPAQAEAEEASKAEDAEKQKTEDEEKQKAEEEQKLIAEIEERQKIIDAITEDLDNRPLVAVNADFSYDRKNLAHDFAEQQLNAEVAGEKREKAKNFKEFMHNVAGATKDFGRRIWKGNLFKKYYQKKYEREILSGERNVTVNGETMDIDDVVQTSSGSDIERFVLSVTNDYDEMVHTQAGESLTPADAETTEAVKGMIEWYAAAEIPEGGSLEDLRREFDDRVNRYKAEKRDQGEPINEALFNNYYKVAVQARERVAHGIAMEKVMDGFQVYEADVRGNIRTDAHRDNIDKIVNRYEESKLGRFIPPEIVAAALGTAYSLTQVGARAAVGAGLGIGVSGVFAGLRERNRVTEDRARMLRDAAVGLGYSGTNMEDGEEVAGGRIAKKRAKYEARIGGTLYDLRSATELTDNLEAASNGSTENSDALLQAIAEARVRVDFSDSEKKDLISYSSADKVGDERLALDLALIRAERSLSDADREKLAQMRDAVRTSITESVDENDSDFRKERTKLALKASAKMVAIGATTFFASQEIMAAVDPDKIGIFEKAGILKTENNADAEETILASAFGFNRGVRTIENVSSEESYRLEQSGYKRVETSPAWSETKTDVVEMDPASAATQNFKIDGWANNGTTVSDGNELRAYLQNGQFSSGMSGSSTLANGQVLNYDELAAAGRIKGYLTIGGARFELESAVGPNGNLVWGSDGVFTTATGETIKAIGDNGEKLYKYFEIALDNGTDAEGITHIIPFATDAGRDTFTGTIQKVTERIIEHDAEYTMVKNMIKVPVTDYATEQVVRGITGSGVILPNLASRVGLGAAERASEPEPEPESGEEIIDVYTTPPSPEISLEGSNLLTSEEPLTLEMERRIARWWPGLDDSAKQQVRDHLASIDQNSDEAIALRTWLGLSGQA